LAARLRSSLRKRVMQGRNSPGEWDDAVSEWRREAGDKMRAEYEPARETRY
jgi:putative aldouronate transport system substrate-binding protein